MAKGDKNDETTNAGGEGITASADLQTTAALQPDTASAEVGAPAPADNFNGQGGSYVADPVTDKLMLIERTDHQPNKG